MKRPDFSTLEPKKNILIKGAPLHNLKNLDVAIPRNKLVVITGLSGSENQVWPLIHFMPKDKDVM